MKELKCILTHKEGLHARPAAKLAQLASTYHGRIDIIYQDFHMTLKSIIGLMSLGISEGCEFSIQVEGHDEETFMHQIKSFLIEEELI
ncbi:MAG: HPr family phosphocarrier protein [Acholeplasmataceae bacterium]|jgi:phosphocarrier protein|nr:HPr family phosphocarrier protein [Acholeplasmataceae bacterium]